MSAETNIEWCDSTFNPWIGCTKVSPACDDCYAARSTPARTLGVIWGPKEDRRHTSAANWALPRRWNAAAAEFRAKHGRRQRVFCASLADVFDNAVPVQWRIELMRLIMETPNLDWLLLTKRIGNAAEMLETAMRGYTAQREGWRDNVPPHVWIGATICNQEEAWRDIPKLLAVPARVRFLSIEPLLGPVDLSWNGWMEYPTGLDWVIAGGESGPKARPMHPDWVRELRDQCEADEVPFLFKQWGEWSPMEEKARIGDAPVGHFVGDFFHAGAVMFGGLSEGLMQRVGKKAAGRLLDGVEHNGFPIGGAA